MIKDERGEWINAKEYAELRGVAKDTLYSVYFQAKKRGNTSKFKKINSVMHFLMTDYDKNATKRRLEALYYEVIEHFENNDFAFADYFSKKMQLKTITIYVYFRRFIFKKHKRNLEYIATFEKFLKEKNDKF